MSTPMYVCNCNGLRGSDIRPRLAQCHKPADVFKRLGTRPKCGRCVQEISDLLHEHRANEKKGALQAAE